MQHLQHSSRERASLTDTPNTKVKRCDELGITARYLRGAQHKARGPHAARKKPGCDPLDTAENVSILRKLASK